MCGAQVTAELIQLRRKMTDLKADNELLSQNFLMVQARYREVVGQRDEERETVYAKVAALEEEADDRVLQVSGAAVRLLTPRSFWFLTTAQCLFSNLVRTAALYSYGHPQERIGRDGAFACVVQFTATVTSPGHRGG